MVHRGRRFAIVGIVACLALGALVVATRSHPSAPTPAAVYPYPPNARQLIAAGLTGRPVGQTSSGPVTIDLVLVDGMQTTVLCHAMSGGATMPFLTLSYNRGRLYQPRVTSLGGSGFAMLRRPGGWQGFLWDLLRLVPFAGANQPARGYTSFASLPPTVRLAIIRIVSGGRTQIVRVPLHLAALRTLATTVVVRRRASRNGIVVTLRRVTHGAGSAQLVYTVDAPATGGGPLPGMQGTLSDARGHQLIPTGGSGTCGAAMGRTGRMHCDQTVLLAPLPKGTLVRLTVTMTPPSGRGVLSGSGVVVSFRMP
jgi:hypothetical protein